MDPFKKNNCAFVNSQIKIIFFNEIAENNNKHPAT